MMKKFLLKFLILLSTVFVMITTINFMYQKSIVNFGTMGIHKNDSAYITDVPEKIEIANFGNSHGYYGFNYEQLDGKFTCFNFSLPSQSMSYNYLILDSYRSHFKSGGVVFLCVSYSTLFGEREIDNPYFLSKNRRYYKFLDKRHIKKYDYNYDLYINWFPVLIAPPGEIFRSLIGQDVSSKDWWHVGTNETDAKIHGDARTKGWIGINNKQQVINVEEVEATYKIIALCRELGLTPIMITTPYLAEYTNPITEHNKEFYRLFYNTVNDISRNTGVRYIDYAFDSRFKHDYSLFFNTDHMNRLGAEKFTDILTKDIGIVK